MIKHKIVSILATVAIGTAGAGVAHAAFVSTTQWGVGSQSLTLPSRGVNASVAVDTAGGFVTVSAATGNYYSYGLIGCVGRAYPFDYASRAATNRYDGNIYLACPVNVATERMFGQIQDR